MTDERISSYKLVNTSVLVNQTQPVLLSQPHLKGKRQSLCANSNIDHRRWSKICALVVFLFNKNSHNMEWMFTL